MAISETAIANMALARVGAKRISSLEKDESLGAVWAREHYEQTRDALLRSHWWRFATARATLSEETTDPEFEWDNAFGLPDDFHRMIYLFDTKDSYALEGNLLLTDDDSAEIVYVKKVEDPTEFDALFVEVLVLQLAVKLVPPLSQDKVLRREIQDELAVLMSRTRTIDKQETNTKGRADMRTWVEARLRRDRIDSQLGSN